MLHFSNPTNALKRAEELVSVGQKDAALVALHDVLSSKRHRTWQPAIEEVMTKFLDICVDMKKGKAAKDGLVQYRIICQQINVASMEHVLRYFMQLAEEETQRSIDAAAAQIDTSLASLLDFEDLEAEETPESLMLSTIGGSSDSKKRIERQLITPTLKFLWETFRTVLEILRNNTKLEDLYRDTALRAFAFCSKYKRSAEFRRLCDILRNHIQSQTKYDPKWKDREPPTPESLQAHLETRFAQLGTATDMELWQEAYRTVEDVHSLVMTMKKQPRPASMAAYHAQLAKIFWVADNGLFHAYATSRLFSITRTMKAHQDPAELQLLASRAVVAALAIPPVNPVLDVNLLEYDLEHEKTKRMASMLAFPTNASRVELLDDIRSKGLLTLALPEVRQLHDMMENAFVPLDLSAQAAPLLQVLQEMGEPLAQYDLALRRLVALRVLQQMERVYLTIRIDHVGRAITLLPWAELETLILWAVKRELLTMRIDYKNGTINQRRAKADATASNEVREKLSRFASSLEAVSERLHAVDIERRKAEARARLYGSIDAGVEEEHQKILSRRLIIERRKEEQERVMMEEEKERARVKAIKQREEEAEEKARLASEAQRRDVERLQKERDEEEAAQMRKLAEQVAEQRKEMKVTKKKGQDPSTKVETDVDKLLTKDKKELLREQQALMMDERSEFEKRLESMAKRHDHMERARRQEERALLLLAFDDEQAADRAAHEARTEELKAQMRETREHDLAEKKRFARMGAAVKDFTERMLSARAVAHEAVVEAWREEQARLREEARKEAERIEAEERARELALEAARREAEEEEARRIQASQEAQRKKREEEEERLRVQEKQKQREKEMEEKARQAEDQRRLDRLAERQKAGTAWGEEDTEEPSLPQLRARGTGDAAAKEEAGAAAKEAAAGAGGWTRAPERRDRPAPSDRWEQHRMGEDRPVGTRHEEEPRHGGDRWEARRDRPPPPRDGPGTGGGDDRWSRGPREGPRDFGDRGPPRRGFEERGPPREGGDDRWSREPRREGQPRGDRPPPPRDGPGTGGGDDRWSRGPREGPRDFGDRGPPRRGFEERGPPREGGDDRWSRGPREGARDLGDRGPPRRAFDDRGPPRREGGGTEGQGGGSSWRRA